MKKYTKALFHVLIGQFMFHATHASDEYALQTGVTATPLDPTQSMGRVRIGHFNYTALTSADGDTLNLLKMPAGKVRVLRACVQNSAFAASTVLDLGYGAYTDRDSRVAIAADPDAFVVDADVNATTDKDLLVDVVVDSAGGWTLTGTLTGGAGTAESLSGWVEYVVD
ncbi:MAG TPA: hypothetical protein VD999_07920 [Vitreimonas sp.]|nr:hypothetical protein [Vitreimonas sp.]